MAFILPSANNTDQIGDSGQQFAAIYGQTIFQNGAQVANRASPTFTGVPLADTAIAGTSTTQLATTEFVQNELAVSGGIAGASIADDSVTNAKLSEVAAWTFKGRNSATTGNPEDFALADVTAEGTPASGMFAIGFLSTGEIRKFDIGDLPGANAITASSTDTLTNKSISGATNTLTAIPTAALDANAVTNAKMAEVAAWTFKARNDASTGDIEDVALADLSEEGTPATGMFAIGFLATGELRKFDMGNLPATGITAASVNTLTNKSISGALNTITALPTASYADDSVTNAKLANVAAWTLKGNPTVGSADPSDFEVDDLTEDSAPASTSWLMVQLPTGELRKTAIEDAGAGYSNENAIDAVGGAMTDGDSINFTFSDPSDSITAEIDPKTTANLTGGSEGELGYDTQGAYVVLGDTSKTAARGDWGPTEIQKDALDNATGTPAAGNPYILANLSDLTAAEPVTDDDLAVDIAGTGLSAVKFQELFGHRYDKTALSGGAATDFDEIATAARTLGKVFTMTDTAGCGVQRNYRLETKTLTEFATTVNATTNLFTSTASNLQEGQKVQFYLVGAATLPSGIALDTQYFVIASGLTANDYKVSTTLAGTEVDVLDTGTGSYTMMPVVEPFYVRPTDYEVGVNVRAWNLVSEGLDKLHYAAFGPEESITVATHDVAYAEHDFRVCKMMVNMYGAPAGSGSGTVTINILVDGDSFFVTTIDLTAAGQITVSDVDTDEFVEGIIRQGQLIQVVVSDAGGATAGTGLDLIFLGDSE